MKITDKLHGFIWNSMEANNCNTYLIDSEKRILIDPGHIAFFDHVRKDLDRMGLKPGDIDLVICTHAHPDHLEAASLFKNEKTLFAMHETEWKMVKDMEDYVRATYGKGVEAVEPDILLKEGNLKAGDVDMAIFHTPGHSPGSICLYWPEEQALFSGDLVFKTGFGRTDLPGGDGRQLKTSIERVAELDVKWLLPGHGNIIGGRDEAKANFDHIRQMVMTYL